MAALGCCRSATTALETSASHTSIASVQKDHTLRPSPRAAGNSMLGFTWVRATSKIQVCSARVACELAELHPKVGNHELRS